VVVCGAHVNANRREAYAVEATVGQCKRGEPHDFALPDAGPPLHRSQLSRRAKPGPRRRIPALPRESSAFGLPATGTGG